MFSKYLLKNNYFTGLKKMGIFEEYYHWLKQKDVLIFYLIDEEKL